MVSLASSKLFAQLPAEQVKRLTAASRELRFGPGEVIFKEGDPGDGLYVVLSGRVQISATIAGGERHVFSTVGAGDVFGEMAVLDSLPRSAHAHASAEGEATLVFVPREQFLDLLKNSPALSLAMVQEISRRVRDINAQYIGKVLQVERMGVVGRFASTIVHDLKNPLAIIRVGVALGAAEKATADDRQAARKRVEVQIDRITSMVNDILDFTRGTPQQVVMARLELNLFIERVFSEFEPELSTKGIKIEFEGRPPTTKLSLNPHRLSRAVYNIVF